MKVFTDAHEFHSRFDHTFRCIAITAHDAVGKRPVISSDTHSCAIFFADADQWGKFFIDTFQLGLVSSICIVNLIKLLFVGIVAGIDTYFFDDTGSDLGSIWCKVDISYQWHLISADTEFPLYVGQVFGFLDAWGSDTYVLTAGVDHTDGLFDRALCIHRVYR